MPSSLSTQALTEFCAVAANLSFARAAEALQLHPSVLSRRIKALEASLGTPLFHRHTRSVTLTEAGAALLPHAQDLLSRLADAEAVVARFSAEPTGVLRLALPTSFGQIAIGPLLADFRRAHPGIELELSVSDDYIDLIEDRFDAAIRIGVFASGAGLKARRLAEIPRYLCAAPAYLARAPEVNVPSDLAQHDLLHFSPLAAGPVWKLSESSREVEIPVRPKLAADNAVMLRQAALDGAGIALLAGFLVDEDLRSERLVEVLPAFRPQPAHVWIVFPDRPILARKTRAFIDFLVERWKAGLAGADVD
ncbi:LysR family transcriptional regulator [Erythrobacter sp.]|uniref:LysR family transcriptional regulator n=1 Tax=Erythrobacter sp. TaxID=1042 RepID=UPI001B0A8D25|nr:LysR family transcriptional regulator [Erythrobacter sp.]MBO6526637.1 LysR family transcriptional regulator [Erythrobacter sp.]MBO6529153.1 LysR family transcriptional regulator [Erythrobacter sp.]